MDLHSRWLVILCELHLKREVIVCLDLVTTLAAVVSIVKGVELVDCVTVGTDFVLFESSWWLLDLATHHHCLVALLVSNEKYLI